MGRPPIALVFGLVSSPLADAALGSPCVPLADLRARVGSCGDNSDYTDAAKDCVARYEQEVEKEQQRLAKALGSVAEGSSQAGKLDQTTLDYGSALRSLQAAINQGRSMKAEIEGYRSEIVLPDGIEELATPSFLPTFLAASDCYSGTKSLLKKYEEIMGRHIKTMELTSDITRLLGAAAARGETGLAAELLSPGLSRRPAPGKSTGVPKKTPRNGKSTITGDIPPEK